MEAYAFTEHLKQFHPADYKARGNKRMPSKCTQCGAFLPAWDWEEVDEEDDRHRYTRVVWFAECSKCGLMNTEDD